MAAAAEAAVVGFSIYHKNSWPTGLTGHSGPLLPTGYAGLRSRKNNPVKKPPPLLRQRRSRCHGPSGRLLAGYKTKDNTRLFMVKFIFAY